MAHISDLAFVFFFCFTFGILIPYLHLCNFLFYEIKKNETKSIFITREYTTINWTKGQHLVWIIFIFLLRNIIRVDRKAFYAFVTCKQVGRRQSNENLHAKYSGLLTYIFSGFTLTGKQQQTSGHKKKMRRRKIFCWMEVVNPDWLGRFWLDMVEMVRWKRNRSDIFFPLISENDISENHVFLIFFFIF